MLKVYVYILIDRWIVLDVIHFTLLKCTNICITRICPCLLSQVIVFEDVLHEDVLHGGSQDLIKGKRASRESEEPRKT